MPKITRLPDMLGPEVKYGNNEVVKFNICISNKELAKKSEKSKEQNLSKSRKMFKSKKLLKSRN